jgi:nucleoside-diphosphate-sugar epimerase
MKALVTGGTGFIGSHLTESLLRQGFEVTCLVRDKSRLRNLTGIDVPLIEADCELFDSLEAIGSDYHYIFHLAGLTKAPSAEAFYSANALAVENLVKICLKKGMPLKRFVYVSSLAAVGPSCDGTPLSECCLPRPVSDYGRSKLRGEQVVYSVKEEMPVTIIRPPAVYGPRDRDMYVLFKMIKLGISVYWGRCQYSFIYIDDLINGIIRSALHEKAEGEILFLSDGNIYTNSQVTEAIANAVGCNPVRLRMPRFLMGAIAFALEKAGDTGIVNPDKIRELKQEQWICYNKKACELIGFVPKIDLWEGAQWTANWYRKERWL